MNVKKKKKDNVQVIIAHAKGRLSHRGMSVCDGASKWSSTSLSLPNGVCERAITCMLFLYFKKNKNEDYKSLAQTKYIHYEPLGQSLEVKKLS